MKKTTIFKTTLFVTILFFLNISSSAATYSYTFTTQVYTAYDTQNLGGVNWTAVATGNTTIDIGFDGASGSPKGQRFGLSTIPTSIPKSITMKTSEISGVISSILVRTAGSAPLDATVSISVGGVAFTVNGNTSMPVLGDPKSPYYTFIGSASGEIVISWLQPTTTKALFIKTIEITNDIAAGIEKVENKLSVTASNGKIFFDSNSGEKIKIFNALGNNILSTTAIQGKNSILLAERGLYIIKAGNKLSKVIL